MNEVFKNEARESILSPWVTLVTRTISSSRSAIPRDFHSLKQPDYVCIFAITKDGLIPLVRQYRPVLDRYTLELPSGLLEKGEDPQVSALRELFEETGYLPGGKVHKLGCMSPDTGRLENRLWAFAALDVIRAGDHEWQPEASVEQVVVSREEFRRMVLSGRFDHAMNLAVLALAAIRGHFSW